MIKTETDICPAYDTCFIAAMMKTMGVPHLLQYCRHGYPNCRYYSSEISRANIKEEAKEAAA